MHSDCRLWPSCGLLRPRAHLVCKERGVNPSTGNTLQVQLGVIYIFFECATTPHKPLFTHPSQRSTPNDTTFHSRFERYVYVIYACIHGSSELDGGVAAAHAQGRAGRGGGCPGVIDLKMLTQGCGHSHVRWATEPHVSDARTTCVRVL